MCTYHTVGTDTTYYVEYHIVHRYTLTYHLTYSRHSHLKIEFPSFLRFIPLYWPFWALDGLFWPPIAPDGPELAGTCHGEPHLAPDVTIKQMIYLDPDPGLPRIVLHCPQYSQISSECPRCPGMAPDKDGLNSKVTPF